MFQRQAPLLAIAMCLAAINIAHADPMLINTFNPGLGTLTGIGFDPATGNVYLHDEFASIHEYTPTGVFVKTIPTPGPNSNDIDLEFAPEPINIGGTVVPFNTFIVTNAESNPQTIYGVNKNTGAVLASQAVVANQLVGASYDLARNTFFGVDWSADVIREYDPSDGTQLNSFTVVPAGSPGFDVFFGDIESSPATGDLYIVSSSQNRVRRLTPLGDFVGDIDVSGLGVGGMAGIALDDFNDEAWISSTNGTVYHLGGLVGATFIPEPSSAAVCGGVALCVMLRRRRK